MSQVPSFHYDVYSYRTDLGLLSPYEVVMNEDLCSWFTGLDYEKRFGPGEVPSFEVRKRRINTHAIVSVVSWEERKKVFSEDIVI